MDKKKPVISIIAAIGKNRELGKNNQLLWNIPEDIKYFRSTILGHPVIMGRKTFESIGRLLPHSPNIIVSRKKDFSVPKSAFRAFSLEEAINITKKFDTKELFIIGGAQIYSQALKLADRLYITVIESTFDADTYFPEYQNLFTKIISQRSSQGNGYTYTFFVRQK